MEGTRSDGTCAGPRDLCAGPRWPWRAWRRGCGPAHRLGHRVTGPSHDPRTVPAGPREGRDDLHGTSCGSARAVSGLDNPRDLRAHPRGECGRNAQNLRGPGGDAHTIGSCPRRGCAGPHGIRAAPHGTRSGGHGAGFGPPEGAWGPRGSRHRVRPVGASRALLSGPRLSPEPEPPPFRPRWTTIRSLPAAPNRGVLKGENGSGPEGGCL